MKGKTKRRALAGFLAALMVFSLIPVSKGLDVNAAPGDKVNNLTVTDNSTSGTEQLVTAGTTTLELEHSKTGGFKNDATGNKADMAFLLSDVLFEVGYTISADITVTERVEASGNDGLFIGAFEGTKVTDGYYAVGVRNNPSVRSAYMKSDGTYGSGSPKIDEGVELNTVYTISVKRTADGFTGAVTPAGGAEVNASSKYSNLSVAADTDLYAGIAISGCKGTVQNMKITDADGAVVYDQNNLGGGSTTPDTPGNSASYQVVDNSTSGTPQLTVSGTTVLALEHSATGGLKNDSTESGNKSDMAFLMFDQLFEVGAAISADLTVTERVGNSGNDGIFIGAFEGTKATDGYYAVGVRNNPSVRSAYKKSDGTYGSGSPKIDEGVELNTVYTISVKRTADGFTGAVTPAGGAEVNASSKYSNLGVAADTDLYPAVAISGCKATVQNLKITNAAGEVIYDQNNGSIAPDVPVPRKDWADVAAPVLGTPVQKGTDIEVPYTMVMGDDGADKITVVMKDASGNQLDSKSTASKTATSATFTGLTTSGVYTFSAIAFRTGDEANAKAAADVTCNFVLPLKTPSISTATSTGSGSVTVVWGAVPEAETYEVYCDGTLVGTTADTSYVVKGLTVGAKCAFTVVAVRGADKSAASEAVEVTVTAEAQQAWGFTRYGSSTNSADNGYEGSVSDGKVTVYSEGGKGKVVPNSTDGLAFYFTTVPADTNFTLKANVHVDNWTLSNGQEGFGLLATDRLGENGVTSPVWNNQYMVLASKVEYFWNSSDEKVDVSGTKYTMKSGLGVIEKTGVTKENLSKFEANDTATINNDFRTSTTPLDTLAAKKELEAGTYNIVGNATNSPEGTIAEYTDFVLELQRNNTGYFVTYYDAAGKVIAQQKYYDPDILCRLDSDNIYVGFFASRNARATFTDISFTTIKASEDAPAEERPITVLVPTCKVVSAVVANTPDYTFSLVSNVDGTVKVTANGKVIADGTPMTADIRLDIPTTLTSTSKNKFIVEFYPDPAYTPDEYTVLENTNAIKINMDVNRNVQFADRVNIYVAPRGSSMGTGSESNPLDIYTAVKYAQPGQTIILKGGTYSLDNTVTVPRGVNGTAENPIRMIADPNSSSRPVFDFKGACAGMVLAGDYWYFQGFDCTHSQNAQKGIQVSGSHNVLDGINAYHNGNTGIQISRLNSTDLFPDWPSYNLILNCTSYGNADAGYEDADGFAAKLTIGDGNVFDGCLAYNNADDGWDLFAKVETGSIGSVTIQNCVAYGNGYLEDGTNAGNGNGFKMGGDSLSGYHKLINSYAFFNKAKGIDSNSCPDIQVENSISYNNESYNVAFYTNNAANTDFSATGIISFKDETIKKGLTTGEQHKPVGSQNTSKYLGDTNYYWDGTKSANASGAEVTASWFKSLTFTGVTRNADGTLNLNGFLELTDAAADGVGAVPGGTSSGEVVVKPETAPPDEEDSSGSAIGGNTAASTETVVEETSNYDNYVPVSVFAELMNSGKTLVVNAVDDAGNVTATYTIDGTKFTATPASDFLLRIYEDTQNGGILDILKAQLNVDSKDADIIEFAYVGALNGEITVKVKLLSGKFAPGTATKLYYFNESTRALEDQGQTVVIADDGTATFTISHCSSYVLVAEGAGAAAPQNPATGTPEAPKTADGTPLALMMLFVLLSGAAFIVVSKRRITE